MAMKIEITEYEVEAEDHGPETTRDRQVVLYFRSSPDTEILLPGDGNEAQLQALIYRTKIIIRSEGARVIIYTDGVVKAEAKAGIAFIDSSEH
jgi:hypothetical protein